MQNSDHKIIYASSSSAPPKIFLPLESESQIPILVNDIVNPLEVRMFPHGNKDIVEVRPKSIGVLEGKIPTLPIPFIQQLKENEAGVVNATDCHSGST